MLLRSISLFRRMNLLRISSYSIKSIILSQVPFSAVVPWAILGTVGGSSAFVAIHCSQSRIKSWLPFGEGRAMD